MSEAIKQMEAYGIIAWLDKIESLNKKQDNSTPIDLDKVSNGS